MNEKNYCLYEHLDEMRERPAMYIGVKSIVRLGSYLDGYYAAMLMHGIQNVCSPAFPGIEFHDWVAKKLGYYESTAGWCNMILGTTLGRSPKHPDWKTLPLAITPEDEATALDRFYDLVDEYRGQQPMSATTTKEKEESS